MNELKILKMLPSLKLFIIISIFKKISYHIIIVNIIIYSNNKLKRN